MFPIGLYEDTVLWFPHLTMGQNIDNWNYSVKCKYLAFLASNPDSLITTVLLVFKFAPKYFRSILKALLSYFTFFCYDGHHDQKQYGEERVCFILQLTVHLWGKPGQELQQGWNLKQKPWKNSITVLISLVYIQPAILHNTGPSAQGWYHTQWAGLFDIHQQSKNTPNLPIWWRQSPRWDSMDNSGLCQVDSGSYLELYLTLMCPIHRKGSLCMLNVSLALITCFYFQRVWLSWNSSIKNQTTWFYKWMSNF